MNKEPADIYIDELQEFASSRRSISKANQTASQWASQIRKVLGYDELNNLTLITQRPMSCDITFRELAHQWILCKKQLIPKHIPTVMHDGEVIKLP